MIKSTDSETPNTEKNDPFILFKGYINKYILIFKALYTNKSCHVTEADALKKPACILLQAGFRIFI